LLIRQNAIRRNDIGRTTIRQTIIRWIDMVSYKALNKDHFKIIIPPEEWPTIFPNTKQLLTIVILTEEKWQSSNVEQLKFHRNLTIVKSVFRHLCQIILEIPNKGFYENIAQLRPYFPVRIVLKFGSCNECRLSLRSYMSEPYTISQVGEHQPGKITVIWKWSSSI